MRVTFSNHLKLFHIWLIVLVSVAATMNSHDCQVTRTIEETDWLKYSNIRNFKISSNKLILVFIDFFCSSKSLTTPTSPSNLLVRYLYILKADWLSIRRWVELLLSISTKATEDDVRHEFVKSDMTSL